MKVIFFAYLAGMMASFAIVAAGHGDVKTTAIDVLLLVVNLFIAFSIERKK